MPRTRGLLQSVQTFVESHYFTRRSTATFRQTQENILIDEQTLGLHQNDTNPNHTYTQSHSEDAHKNSTQWGQTSLSRCCDARRCLARRGGIVGVNYTMLSRLATVFEVVAVVIRPYAL